MNNLLSYCGLFDANIRASGKDLTVNQNTFRAGQKRQISCKKISFRTFRILQNMWWIRFRGQTTKVMGQMNKIVDPQAVAKTMQEFEMANAKMEMTEETSTYLLFIPGDFSQFFPKF